MDEVLKEARNQAVIGIVEPILQTSNSDLTLQNQASYIRQLHEQNNLIQFFNDNSIPLVVIKGTAAAMYYPKPYQRNMGDIDILVSRKHFNNAMELMESNGYKRISMIIDNVRHIEYTKNGIVFELHNHFIYIYL